MKMLRYFVLSVVVGGFALAEEETQLGGKMEEMSDTLKGLRRLEGDWAGSLKVVREAQQRLLECFAWTPAMLEKMPEGKAKEEATANYKRTLAESYIRLCDLELAYLSEDQAKVDVAMDAVKESRKDGHEQFIEEE